MVGADDRYTDLATGVLRNRLGIHDAALLEQAETVIASGRALDLQARPIRGAYDFDHLRAGQLARERGLEIAWNQVPRDRMEAAKEHAMHVDSSRLAERHRLHLLKGPDGARPGAAG